MSELPQGEVDTDRIGPAGDPTAAFVEGADVLRPHSPQEFYTHTMRSMEIIGEYGREALIDAAENGADAGKTPNVTSDPEVAALYNSAGHENDITRNVSVPCSTAEVNYLESWDPNTEEPAGRILKVIPSLQVEDFDPDTLTLEQALALHTRQQQAEQSRPEYNWDSRAPHRIKVYKNGQEYDLSDPELGIAELVDAARFLRRTAIRMALDRDDRDTLSKLLPAEHDE